MKVIETSEEYTIEGECECPKCKGTGLYKGFGEQDGARVICYRCDGTGKIKISARYAKFKGRKKDDGCTRVYTQGMGYGITDRDTIINGRLFPFSKYGCSYKDWLKGTKPIPIKFLGCPRQEEGHGLKFDHCTEHYKGGLIKSCFMYPNKAKCWEIFDKK